MTSDREFASINCLITEPMFNALSSILFLGQGVQFVHDLLYPMHPTCSCNAFYLSRGQRSLDEMYELLEEKATLSAMLLYENSPECISDTMKDILREPCYDTSLLPEVKNER